MVNSLYLLWSGCVKTFIWIKAIQLAQSSKPDEMGLTIVFTYDVSRVNYFSEGHTIPNSLALASALLAI